MKHKKIVTTLLILVAFVFSLGVTLHASPAKADLRGDLTKQSSAFGGKQGGNLGKPKDPRLIVAGVINSLLGLLGTLALGYAVYGGATIMMSGGAEDKVTKGKNILKNTVIGLFIILSAYSITRLAVRVASGNKAEQGTNCKVSPSNDAKKDPLGGYNKGESVYQDCIEY
jgi:hypothetical protein